jgi:hypothetical protein
MCGGAAAAMVFRYWGDRHADVQQFAPFVDRRAGGIADDVLVAAIRDREWRAARLDGTMDALRAELTARRPVILLIRDRPTRYHYVVAIGFDEEFVYLHDPSWGPSRRFPLAEFERVWQASNNWSLLVQPVDDRTSPPPGASPAPSPVVQREPASSDSGRELPAPDQGDARCDRLLDAALDDIERRGFAAADELLTHVSGQCPGSSRVKGEMAGVRFAERRWKEAAALAEEAVGLDAGNTYAWDVLGSSRFVQDDYRGALRAWNNVGKPRLDSVRIEGLSHTRYALVAQALGLTTNAVLSADAFGRAERRLDQLPTRSSARIDLRPEADGFAVVDIAIVERPIGPRGAVGWAAETAEALVNREVKAMLPGWTGEGEAWTAALRWWAARPRALLSFAVPRTGFLPGVWRVSGSWERETYTSGVEERFTDERAHAGIGVADWITSQLRYELNAGVDSWRTAGRAASIGGTIERRLAQDRVALRVSAQNWVPLTGTNAFRTASLRLDVRSRTTNEGLVHSLRVGGYAATISAPLSLWGGAGEGQARAPLLRAHPLLHDGAINGPVFGRRTTQATVESIRWFSLTPLARVGVAGFLDVAHAWRRLPLAAGDPLQADAGAGFRLRVPGREGTLRVDYARGLRDGASAITLGWTID